MESCVCDLLGLASFTRPKVFEIHSHYGMCRYFIPFYGWWYSTVWLHRIWFIHSSCDGHLSCSHILAPLWIVLLWTFVGKNLFEHVFSSLEYIPQSGLLGHMVILLDLLSNCRTVPRWLCHFTLPLAMCEGSNFSTFSPTLIFHFLGLATLLSVKSCLVVWFWLAFLLRS